MLNWIWAGMIAVGILYGAFSGNMEAVANGAMDAAGEAVQLCITMMGVTALWTGLMRIAQNAGLVQAMTRGIGPAVSFLFPRIPKDHPAREFISTNLIANFLGLGWAATPSGLKAMEALERLEEERRTHKRERKGAVPRGTANSEMCTFLILNISSLQLIPVNVIAYRAQYGSVNPTAVIGPGIVATAISTLAAVLFCKGMDRKRRV